SGPSADRQNVNFCPTSPAMLLNFTIATVSCDTHCRWQHRCFLVFVERGTPFLEPLPQPDFDLQALCFNKTSELLTRRLANRQTPRRR
ncbi:hypothetical protein BaRGS_00011205, partial [Batillaria attramentaria]